MSSASQKPKLMGKGRQFTNAPIEKKTRTTAPCKLNYNSIKKVRKKTEGLVQTEVQSTTLMYQ